jgi:hypothetical protein
MRLQRFSTGKKKFNTRRLMRIVIGTVQVPLVFGGAELHAEDLRSALIATGHEAEIVTIPFGGKSPDQILECMHSARQIAFGLPPKNWFSF